MQFRLIVQNQVRDVSMLYDTEKLSLRWEETGEPVNLEPMAQFISPQKKTFRPFVPVSPKEPGKKNLNPSFIKIQVGLKCNFSCSYCNQGGERAIAKNHLKSTEHFLTEMPNWYQGGPRGDGSGTRVEFWGGEPLIYWKTIALMATEIRKRYPKIKINMVTNATLLNDEIIEDIDRFGFSIGISHDGPVYGTLRGEDPLLDPEKLAMIRKLYNRLNPQGRISFNCVLTKSNLSYTLVRNYISFHLGVEPQEISIGTEEIVLPYAEGTMALGPQTEDEFKKVVHQVFWEAASGHSMSVSTIQKKITSFYNSLAQGRPADSLGQKCGMDSADNIAVDLKGNVLTCQNSSSEGRHNIGNVTDFEGIKLNTAYHWSRRKECSTCPVLHQCQGACMFLEGKLWKQACENSFAWNLGILAAAIFHLTGHILVSVEAPVIRGEKSSEPIKVINVGRDKDSVAQKFSEFDFIAATVYRKPQIAMIDCLDQEEERA